MALEIRPATAADLAVVTAIYGHAVLTGTATFETEPPDVAEMTRRFATREAGGYPSLAAVLDGAVVGYAEAHAYHHRAGYRFTVEDSIYLDPAAQGQGIGTRLLQALVGESEARGFRLMVAVIGDGNPASIGAHRKVGFEHAGRLGNVGVKFGGWVDVVFMQRALGEGATTVPPGA